MKIGNILREWIKLMFVLAVMVGLFLCSATAEPMVGAARTVVEGAMPCIGNPKVLVFNVTFSGGQKLHNMTAIEIEDLFFSETCKFTSSSESAYSTTDSLRGFYYRSSYGKVDIDGTVYDYTTLNDVTYYTDLSIVVKEIINYYKDEILWDEYDTNGDGYLDGIYIVAKTLPAWEMASSKNYVISLDSEIDGIKANRAAYICTTTVSVLAHETYHMFGFLDIYSGSGKNPNGLLTECIMANGTSMGDIPGISKYFFGWMDNVYHITGKGVWNIQLNSYSTNGALAIVYPNGDPNINSWFIVEYLTNEANNKNEGVRVWRTQITNTVVGEFLQPFGYIEAIAPEGQKNYYFHAGDSLTPRTLPSSAYGTKYLSSQYSCNIDEWAYSGISIHVTSTDGASAKLQISIDDADIDGAAQYTSIDTQKSADFLDAQEKLHFGIITSNTPIQINQPLHLFSPEQNEYIPVIADPYKEQTVLRLSVAKEQLHRIRLDTEYQLVTDGCIQTLGGADVHVYGTEKVIIENLYLSLSAGEDKYTYGIVLENEYQKLAVPSYLRVTTNCFGFTRWNAVDQELVFYSFDTTENIINSMSLGKFADVVATDTLQLGGSGFLVRFTLADGRNVLRVFDWQGNCLEEMDGGELVTFVPSTTGIFGSNQLGTKVYELQENDSKYKWVLLEGVSNYLQKNDSRELYRIDSMDNGDVHVDYQGVASDHAEIRSAIIHADGTGEWLGHAEYFPESLYIEDEVWRMRRLDSTNGDFVVDIFDREGNICKTIELLKDQPIRAGMPTNLKMAWMDDLLIVTFTGQSNIYEGSFSMSMDLLSPAYTTSYLTVFDRDGGLKYYYHSGNTLDDFFKIEYVGNHTFLLIKADHYQYLYLDGVNSDHEHIETKIYGEAATCTSNGISDGIVCAICGLVVRAPEVTDAGNGAHQWRLDVIEPSCYENGRKRYTCTACDAVKEEIVYSTGHNFSVDENISREPSCCIGGWRFEVCDICGAMKEFYLKPTGLSKYHTEYTPPSCEPGLIVTICQNDGYILDRQLIPATGEHIWDAGTVIVAPSCEQSGERHYACTICETEKNETIPPHFWANGLLINVPTPDQFGETSYTCLFCGATKVEAVALGIAGDVNSDSQIDMLDIIDLMEWFCGGIIELNLANADVNGTGEIDMLDIVMLMEWYCGADVTLINNAEEVIN